MEQKMRIFTGKYRYNKPGSGGGTTTTFIVHADSENEALFLAKNQAQDKHPEYEITIIEIGKREDVMHSYSVKYKYNKPGSGSSTTTTFTVRANSEAIAYQLAEDQAGNKHPGYQVTILDLKER